MAISNKTEWDVRTTGDDTNGGGFDTSSTGIDYSQQDTAQVTYSDLVIGGTTTELTSSANPFTSDDVGNIINITAGTGFITGRYQVISVASSIATMDQSVGTASSTGGTGKLGGALATPDSAFATAPAASYKAGNTIHIQAGTYTRTTTMSIQQNNNSVSIIGYQTTHRDGGTRPLITTVTNSIALATVGYGQAMLFQNLSFSHAASVRGIGIASNGGGVYPTLVIVDCIIDGCTWGVNADNQVVPAGYIFLSKSEIKNCSAGGVGAFFGVDVFDSFIHDIIGTAVYRSSNQGNFSTTIARSIIARTTKGLDMGGSGLEFRIFNSVFFSMTSDGIFTSSNGGRLQVENSIFYDCGGWGINVNASTTFLNCNNAYGANVSGNRNNYPQGDNEVTLTADPFTNSTGNDFSLNTTAGAGAACKGVGYPGVFPGGTSTGALDIGAVQSAGGGGGGASGGGSFVFLG